MINFFYILLGVIGFFILALVLLFAFLWSMDREEAKKNHLHYLCHRHSRVSHWWYVAGVAVLILGIKFLINMPLWDECRFQGFSESYCFWQMK